MGSVISELQKRGTYYDETNWVTNSKILFFSSISWVSHLMWKKLMVLVLVTRFLNKIQFQSSYLEKLRKINVRIYKLENIKIIKFKRY